MRCYRESESFYKHLAVQGAAFVLRLYKDPFLLIILSDEYKKFIIEYMSVEERAKFLDVLVIGLDFKDERKTEQVTYFIEKLKERKEHEIAADLIQRLAHKYEATHFDIDDSSRIVLPYMVIDFLIENERTESLNALFEHADISYLLSLCIDMSNPAVLAPYIAQYYITAITSDKEYIVPFERWEGIYELIADYIVLNGRAPHLERVKGEAHVVTLLKYFFNNIPAVLTGDSFFSYMLENYPALREDREIMLFAVRQDGMLLQYASPSLKRDVKVVTAAVEKNGLALQHADDSLKRDRKVVLAAVSQKGTALSYADKSMRQDEEIVLAAVSQRGGALQNAAKIMKGNRKVVLAAVKQRGTALQYADDILKRDRELVLIAVKQRGTALQYADESLRRDKEIVLAAVNQHKDAFCWVDDGLKRAGESLKDFKIRLARELEEEKRRSAAADVVEQACVSSTIGKHTERLLQGTGLEGLLLSVA